MLFCQRWQTRRDTDSTPRYGTRPPTNEPANVQRDRRGAQARAGPRPSPSVLSTYGRTPNVNQPRKPGSGLACFRECTLTRGRPRRVGSAAGTADSTGRKRIAARRRTPAKRHPDGRTIVVTHQASGRVRHNAGRENNGTVLPMSANETESRLEQAIRQSNLLREAFDLARGAHDGQFDKAGKPYIDHPLRVASAVLETTNDDELVAAALLHDVVEDSQTNPDDLARAGMTERTVTAVIALTRTAGEAPESYYARVRANPDAIEVKRADIADNSSPERLAVLDEATRQRLIRKYAKAREALGI